MNGNVEVLRGGPVEEVAGRLDILCRRGADLLAGCGEDCLQRRDVKNGLLAIAGALGLAALSGAVSDLPARAPRRRRRGKGSYARGR